MGALNQEWEMAFYGEIPDLIANFSYIIIFWSEWQAWKLLLEMKHSS